MEFEQYKKTAASEVADNLRSKYVQAKGVPGPEPITFGGEAEIFAFDQDNRPIGPVLRGEILSSLGERGATTTSDPRMPGNTIVEAEYEDPSVLGKEPPGAAEAERNPVTDNDYGPQFEHGTEPFSFVDSVNTRLQQMNSVLEEELENRDVRLERRGNWIGWAYPEREDLLNSFSDLSEEEARGLMTHYARYSDYFDMLGPAVTEAAAMASNQMNRSFDLSSTSAAEKLRSDLVGSKPGHAGLNHISPLKASLVQASPRIEEGELKVREMRPQMWKDLLTETVDPELGERLERRYGFPSHYENYDVDGEEWLREVIGEDMSMSGIFTHGIEAGKLGLSEEDDIPDSMDINVLMEHPERGVQTPKKFIESQELYGVVTMYEMGGDPEDSESRVHTIELDLSDLDSGEFFREHAWPLTVSQYSTIFYNDRFDPRGWGELRSNPQTEDWRFANALDAAHAARAQELGELASDFGITEYDPETLEEEAARQGTEYDVTRAFYSDPEVLEVLQGGIDAVTHGDYDIKEEVLDALENGNQAEREYIGPDGI